MVLLNSEIHVLQNAQLDIMDKIVHALPVLT